MSIKIARETFTDELAIEMLPLAQKCWAESTAFKGETCAYYGERDFQIEPDFDKYLAMQAEGTLAYITMREEGELKGYAVGFSYYSLHHRHILCGLGDSMFIEPDYRAHTWALAKRLEKELAELGAKIIGWPVHFQGPVYEILKAKGYVPDDIVMEKRVCVS